MSQELESAIAVVGMACRFPGARTPGEYWENLRDGVESISRFSASELDDTVVDPAEARDPRYVAARGILHDVESFDAGLFGFTPREAELTDPQHRVFLECAWEAFEDAGYDPTRFPGLVGVFGGAGDNTYLLFHLMSSGQVRGSVATLQAFIHNKNDHLTARTAYKLNLRGPAVSVQTACSTSLVAVSMAVQSLLDHQVDMALAGACTIVVPQRIGHLYHERGIGSPDGHCRAFDAEARGTVGGNGAGVVLLKRYEDAVAAGDTIHAVLRGIAVNNDGAMRAGYTAPSADSQSELIALVQALAGTPAESISYVEAHGTGTPIGDPIEIEALARAFRRGTNEKGFCALGSAKTNVGHLDTAAGMAGLLKAVLSLQHRQLPPSLHFRNPNPNIDFANSPFYVNDVLRDWHTRGWPRRAAVSAFGLGGTNAHAVLEEAPPGEPSGPARALHLLLVSGQTSSALEAVGHNLSEHLRRNPELALADVAYTLQVGRRVLPHRRMLVCRDSSEAASLLETLPPERVFGRHQESVRRPLTFMFPGQGTQFVEMGADWYRSEPLFRAEVDRACELLVPHLGLDLRTVLYPAPERRADAQRVLDQTAYAQPALFVIEYAMAKLWMSWGIRPDNMIGHSIGEYVAACMAGVFSLEDALALVAVRGKLIQSLPAGAMLAVHLSERDMQGELSEGLSLAAINGPAQCVVSGPEELVAELQARLSEKRLASRRLRTSHAFHSSMMAPILDAFHAKVSAAARNPPTLRYMSNVTGTWITAPQATDPDYWVTHLRETVRFAEGLDALLEGNGAVLLEVGPGRALSTLARSHPRRNPDQFAFATLPDPRGPSPECADAMETLGRLWLVGIEPDWGAFHAHQRRRRVPLPTYPFERKRHWVDLAPKVSDRTASMHERPDIANWFYVPSWRAAASRTSPAAPKGPKLKWLLFEDDAGLAAGAGDALVTADHEVVRVRAGVGFSRDEAQHFTIDPRRREDYAHLLHALEEMAFVPQRIVHAWSVGSMPASAPLERGLAYGLHSLLFLAQVFLVRGSSSPSGSEELTLTVLASGVSAVLGGDVPDPLKATMAGACRVIPREYPHVRCRLVDVELPSSSWDGRQGGEVVARLLEELLASDAPAVVAHRRGRRWVRDFEPLALHDSGTGSSMLRPNGVYLITGGLGGLGLEIAGWLARTVQAKLVLLGRSAPDARRQKRLRELESDGAEVLALSADVTDARALESALALAKARFGAIHGVVHAAGARGGTMMQRATVDSVAAVLGPKVQGTLQLDLALASESLDFFVLFSSLGTVVGHLGQFDYSAANAFLDAFAEARTARTGSFTTAIAWGPWAEVGMAAMLGRRETVYEGQRIGHPLLERHLVQTANADQEVFVTDFDVREHWVVDEHRIAGAAIVPGVAYFEMVRAALGARAHGKIVTLQNVVFLAPLRVEEGRTREARLILDAERDGHRFTVRSAGAHLGADQQDRVSGRVMLRDTEPPRRYDLEGIRRRCGVRELSFATGEHEVIASPEEEYGPRWHSAQRLHLGHGELLLHLELPEAFTDDLEHMDLHPALLDRAVGVAKAYLAGEGRYLPFSYDEVHIKAPLGREIWSFARVREKGNESRDTVTIDIVLMDQDGRGLVELEGYTVKRVNDSGGRSLAAPSHRDTPPTDDMAPVEGVEAFARILAARVSPEVVVSVRNLHETIERSDGEVRERILRSVEEPPATTDQSGHPRPDLSTPYIAPRNEIEARVAETWQQMLGIDRVGIHDNFFELGGDSLVALQVIARLERAFGVTIPPASIFEDATISKLVEIFIEK